MTMLLTKKPLQLIALLRAPTIAEIETLRKAADWSLVIQVALHAFNLFAVFVVYPVITIVPDAIIGGFAGCACLRSGSECGQQRGQQPKAAFNVIGFHFINFYFKNWTIGFPSALMRHLKNPKC